MAMVFAQQIDPMFVADEDAVYDLFNDEHYSDALMTIVYMEMDSGLYGAVLAPDAWYDE